LEVGAGNARRTVTVTLDLGDMSLAHHVQAMQAERAPTGQRDNAAGAVVAVAADYQTSSGTSREVGANRSITTTGDALVPFGSLPGKAWNVTAGAALSAGSSVTYTTASDVLSGSKHAPRYAGAIAYFDFAGASLNTEVRPTQPAARRRTTTRTGTKELPARVGFPQEAAPLKHPDDPPGAFRPVPRTLPGSRRLGISQAAVAAGAPGARDAADRVATVLPHFLISPESAAGVEDLREQVQTALERKGRRDPKVAEAVDSFLSERTFLQQWGNVIGSGALSEVIKDEQGNERAYLLVTAQLRTAQASTIDELGVREEVKRFINVSDGKSQGGSVGLTLPKIDVGHVIGDPTAALGGSHSAGGGVDLTGSVSSTRTHGANAGAGDIRAVFYGGESVRYLSEMHLTVQVIPTDATADSTVPQVEGDIDVNLRIPQLQRDRFDAMLEQKAEGKAAPLPVDDQPDAALSQRYPPASMAAGQGIGFASISHLAGAEKVLAEQLRLIQDADRDLPWAAAWSPFELAWMRSQLSSRFTREALTSHADALFQPGGMRIELFRLTDSGVEVITVTVSATHDTETSTSGRVADASLHVWPTGYAGSAGKDEIGANLGVTADFGGMGGARDADEGVAGVSVGGTLQGGLTRGSSASTGVSASALAIEAGLYEGPARYFDYGMKIDLTVEVRQDQVVAPGVLRTLVGKATELPKAAWKKLTSAPPAVAPQTGQATGAVEGSVRFIMPEALTRQAPEDKATLEEVGKTEFVDFGTVRGSGAGARPGNEVRLPSIKKHLAADGHVALTSDDQVMEVLGGAKIATHLQRLLRKVGMTDASVRDLAWTLASPEYLAASMVRGPSVIMQTVVQDGVFTDRHAVVTIEGFPTNVRRASPALVRMRQMHIAEGAGIVSYSSGQSSAGSLLFSLRFLLGRPLFQWAPSYTYGRTWGRSKTSTINRVPFSGRLTQQTRDHVENTADMVWRVSVTARDKNFLPGKGEVLHAGTILKVRRGVSFLRHAKPPADPRVPAVRPAGPDTIAVIGRRNAEAGGAPATRAASAPRTRLVPNVPATLRTGERRRLPLVPFPASTLSERLYPLRSDKDAKTGDPAGVTGESNPVLDAVQDLLSKEAPDLLEAHWTIDDGNKKGKKKQVPARLRHLLDLGSMTMLMDLLLGPGLVLHAIRSLPLGNERIQIVLQARRDPYNLG
ncbi:MAG: hypothetical protein QOE61_43, partial [Micromonosporaceae bacterium]|nr:hypothetical protein [Micromonosporaceae bacterium]